MLNLIHVYSSYFSNKVIITAGGLMEYLEILGDEIEFFIEYT